MHKEELISLHQMLIDVKGYLQENNPDSDFSEYESLKITPSQIHRSKVEHKYAIFVLGNAIAKAMKDMENPSTDRMSARMHELAEKALKEIECGS
ncbi:MAG: UPF0058 family protein [Methanospirillum sp.]|uniref:UPF0058 family protein n=1 Tax=Methanospirillum sp. TaxID=45200 RepID=UPI0023738A53|nr:UPF0058 family protein [Methanospirillum sp.]MDD1729464.1 UPF0058 family protein [Methanospirillum sp.]